MKKFVKMSLVAALAVAGTTASAQPLAEAIKNVDVSGTVVYRYDDRGNKTAADANTNHYKVGVSLSSKVNDDVKFNSRFTVNDTFAGFDAGNGNDQAVAVNLTQANFAYTGLANTTVVVGKQGLALPWTNAVDSDGTEQTGTGILAASTLGPVTLVGAYVNQSNITLPAAATVGGLNTAVTFNGQDLLVAGAMANVGPVALKALYLDVQDTADSYFVKASGSFDVDAVKVSVFAQHSELEVDNDTNDYALTKAGISAKMGIFNAGVTYAKTGDEGSGIINNVSENSAIGYSVTLSTADNADAIFVDLGAQITPELHVGLNYDEVSDDSAGAADDHQETFVQITYNMSKNLSTYVRLADGEDGTQDYNRGRLQVEYKF